MKLKKRKKNTLTSNKTPNVYHIIERCKVNDYTGKCSNFDVDYDRFNWQNDVSSLENDEYTEHDIFKCTLQDAKKLCSTCTDLKIRNERFLKNNIEYVFGIISEGSVWNTTYILVQLDLDAPNANSDIYTTERTEIIGTKEQIEYEFNKLDFDELYADSDDIKQLKKDWKRIISKMK